MWICEMDCVLWFILLHETTLLVVLLIYLLLMYTATRP